MSGPEQNHLLAALPPDEQARLFKQLELVALPLGAVLYESGDAQRHIYFPIDAIISLLYVLKDGASAEIAVVGNDGAIGIALFMGGVSTTNRAIVQNAGKALPPDAAGASSQEFARARRHAAHPAALHAGADHADGTDRRVQPAPLAWTSSCAAGCCCRWTGWLPTS